jgi:hypothetical protein
LAQVIGRGLAAVTGEVTSRSLTKLSSVSRKESNKKTQKVREPPGRGVFGRLICATNPSNCLIYNMAFKVSLVFSRPALAPSFDKLFHGAQ